MRDLGGTGQGRWSHGTPVEGPAAQGLTLAAIPGARHRGRGQEEAITVVAGIRGRSELVGEGGLLFFVATAVANGANFVFHVLMSRMLGPSTYGALGSILGLSTFVTLGVTAFQAAVTQAVARHAGGSGAGRPRLRRAVRGSLAAAAGSFAAVAAASTSLRDFLHLSSVVPVILFGGFVAVTVATLVPQGALIGMLRFRTVAIALVLGALVRLAAGALLVQAGLGLGGAVAATLLNAVCSLAVLCLGLRADKRGRPSAAGELRVHPGAAMLSVAALGGISAFVGIDTFLARHFLAPVQAGRYVAAATAARIALFLPASVALLAFPRLAAHGGHGRAARTVLAHARWSVAGLGALAALVLAAAPHLVIAVLFGARYDAAAGSLRVLAVGAAAVGLTTVLVYALLARRSRTAPIAWAGVAAVAIGVAAVHGSPMSVAWVVTVVSGALLVVAELLVGRTAHHREPSA